MPSYKVNKRGVEKAEQLIRDREVDDNAEWPEAQPTPDEENRYIDSFGYGAYGEWHLAVNADASEDTKGRYAFPFGDFSKLNRSGLTSAKQRAAQYEHKEVEEAADRLLRQLDDEP